ncbi:ParB N-terminal domain-containing protein (plasmid) [Priestia megaterium]
MKVLTKKLDDLVPAPYNPRKKLKPGDKEYEKLRKSIKEFGYADPIVWNERTGYVVGGHQRVAVLKDLGYEEVDVSVVDLEPSKEKALNLALNKISGTWDEELLKDLLIEIDTGEFDIELTGFDDGEIEKLMNKFADDEVERPEAEFTEELMEEHNYIVLYFDNSMDWQVAKDKFGITTKAAIDSREGYERKGTGRVVKGSDILDRIN